MVDGAPDEPPADQEARLLDTLSDALHARAVALAKGLETKRTRLVTTQAVLLEVGNALSKRCHRVAAVRLLTSMEADPTVEAEALSPELFAKAFHLYRSRPDKEWGLIDCISFVVDAMMPALRRGSGRAGGSEVRSTPAIGG